MGLLVLSTKFQYFYFSKSPFSTFPNVLLRLFQMSFFDFSKCPSSTFPNVLLRLFQMSFCDFSKCRCGFKLSEVCRSTVHIKCCTVHIKCLTKHAAHRAHQQPMSGNGLPKHM